MTAEETITEHAQLYAGGSMLVWPDHPELLRIFPLEERIQAGQRGGGRVFRRTVIVVEDWTEVLPS